MRSAHKQPNASAGPMPSTSMRVQRAASRRNVWALAGLKGYVATLAGVRMSPFPPVATRKSLWG
jgi:hypothetical protein